MKAQQSVNQSTTPSAVAFYRISTDKQDTERQYSDVRNHCKAWSIEIIQEFEETISGAASIEKRPRLQEMLAYVEANRPTYVICSELSRLARSQDAVTIIKKWREQGICFLTHKEGICTISDDKSKVAMTDFMLDILTAINAFELSTITYRVKSGLHQTVTTGTWSGKAPYGYNIEGQRNTARLVENDEAKTVKDMFKWYSEGWGTHKIASYLNCQNIGTKQGVLWVDSKIYKILSNPIYIGKRKWNTELLDMPEARIIEDGLFYSVQERLQKNANTSDLNKQQKHTYVLQGKIKCQCGRGFVGQHRHGIYMCSSKKYAGGCNTKAVKINWIETEIRQHLMDNQLDLLRNNARLLSKTAELRAELQVLQDQQASEKRTQARLLKSIATIGEGVFQTAYTKSQDFQKTVENRMVEIQRKLQMSVEVDQIFSTTVDEVRDGKLVRIGTHIESEVLKKVIDNISIDNDQIVVTLVNTNQFTISR